MMNSGNEEEEEEFRAGEGGCLLSDPEERKHFYSVLDSFR